MTSAPRPMRPRPHAGGWGTIQLLILVAILGSAVVLGSRIVGTQLVGRGDRTGQAIPILGGAGDPGATVPSAPRSPTAAERGAERAAETTAPFATATATPALAGLALAERSGGPGPGTRILDGVQVGLVAVSLFDPSQIANVLDAVISVSRAGYALMTGEGSAAEHLVAAGTAGLAMIPIAGTAGDAARAAQVLSREERVASAARSCAGYQCYYTVRNREDVLLYVQIHKEHVLKLSQFIKREFPEQFGHLDDAVLARYAAVHDDAKMITDARFLEQHGLERPIADDLVEAWGQDLRQHPHLYETLVNGRVNRIDAEIESRVLDDLGVAPAVRDDYRRIVDLADQVDRGGNPMAREEMNKWVRPASEFNPANADLLRRVESRYRDLFPEDGLEEYLRRHQEMTSRKRP